MTEGTYAAPLGGIDIKITRSTQGVSVEVDTKRPREPGETWDQAALAAATLAATAYLLAIEQMAAIGLTPGRDSK